MKIPQMIFLIILMNTQCVIPDEPDKDRRIIKGTNCKIEKYAHLISIVKLRAPFCGGSLVAKDRVLTAAHCCQEMTNLRQYVILAGQSKWKKDYEQIGQIDWVMMHKDYSLEPLRTDLCVMKLKSPLKLTKKVKISHLVTAEEFNDNKNNLCDDITVLGFGEQTKKAPSLRSSQYKYNPHVQCATLRILKWEHCQGDKDIGQYISDTVFCALDAYKTGDVSADACHGDSGGPVLCDGLQIGVISAGFGCGHPGIPGFYSRVDHYHHFIKKAEFTLKVQESSNPIEISNETSTVTIGKKAVNSGNITRRCDVLVIILLIYFSL